MTNKKNKLIIILGPTASGKTKLAVTLAKIFNSEIISADSRQVYKGMDIGTGKDLKEYSPVRHHLIDVASPKTQFSLAQYQKLAYLAIDDIIRRGKTPFLVGGTGLYLSSVIDGYQLTDVKPDKTLREHLSTRTLEQLQTLVKKYKIKLNHSDFNNKRRLIRIIEKVKKNVRYTLQASRQSKYNCLILGIKFPKNIIDKRIDQRLIHRLEKEKMIEEVKKLHKNGVSWKRLEGFGLEYKWIAYYLQKKISYDEMMAKLSIAINQFAKRQMTWFKRMKKIRWLKNKNQAEKIIKKFL
jgi:tRNA dimethylallyltransferase